ncbi:DUF4837 family protein [Lacinutrix sp. C3R15]|uniref:DUF4837 family protein n=1 Tax=Flavobacteriaceae TaxID=49546 RepID=UPI001C0A02AC|nr:MULTISPECIES: DUF4837 family protein [Flavobacteriaceae]MBU2938038.1 DUF4837 family protein [Lacinutrix sp. C3R15]MDO6621352.1 DUF4837 family protein [Oceanihabitans sp. 1_MG-2023]
MRNFLCIAMVVLLFTSCKDDEKSKKRILSASSGTLNNISVVVANELWEGEVGETIREVLAAPIYGLPQDEPTFTMAQIPPQVFSGFVTKNRTVLKIEVGTEKAEVKVANDVFAAPQKLVLVTGKNNKEIIEQLTGNAAKIVAAFKNEELKEKQRRINLSLHKDSAIKEKLGFSINFPTAYRIAKEENNVFWIRKDITTGTTNLMLYSIPQSAIKKNDSLIGQIIKIRDSINKVYIPGPTEEAYMVTEDAYTPFLSETSIDNKLTLETKGIWDMKNAFMSGPFVNYMIEDKANKRYVVLEAFAFAPSVAKRDYMFELEAIIKSIKIE